MYAEVLEVPDVQTVRVPSKPTINNLLRHSRSEENIAEGETMNSHNINGKNANVESPHLPSSSSMSKSNSSCTDLNVGADCWSQEDDEISQQVSLQPTKCMHVNVKKATERSRKLDDETMSTSYNPSNSLKM